MIAIGTIISTISSSIDPVSVATMMVLRSMITAGSSTRHAAARRLRSLFASSLIGLFDEKQLDRRFVNSAITISGSQSIHQFSGLV